MHDTTSTPALVDIAAMRDELAEAGVDPAVLKPQLPVDVSVDHSLAVEAYARPDAIRINMQHELRRNEERYRFLRWASKALPGVRIHPPGTGIMHTINLEQLATVVTTELRDGALWAVPDAMIGTDSHTPMINGIGVLGWGVGGLEAQTVMFGMPTMLQIPDVVGVRLVGELSPGVLATDLALVVTQRLRALDVTGDFVEFFGPGVAALRAGDRAVIANMAPEYGATTGFFPVDAHTLAYLRDTGRSAEAVELVERYTRQNALWFDPDANPRYSRSIEIDLAAIGMHVAGPRRPQDLLGLADVPAVLAQERFAPRTRHEGLPRHPVAVAAITSCTNTSDPALLIAAGLVARKARARGLVPPPWVKTSLAPGSPAALSYLQRSGLLEDLEAVGFGVVGFGCSTCIGNTGPLTEPVREAQREGAAKAVAMLSGNRNFPGRVHPELELGFIMSPPLVVAFGLAGDAERDLSREPVQTGADGHRCTSRDLWPSKEEVETYLARSRDPADYARDFASASLNPLWLALDAPATPQFPWDPASTALRRPPFASVKEGSQLGTYDAWPLLVVGDDVTTDHISPASAIPADSFVADHPRREGREPPRPQRVRLSPGQLGGDDAGRLLQPVAEEPARCRRAGRPHAARPLGRDAAGVAGGTALSRRGRGGRGGGRRTLRHGLLARLGGQGPAPAGHPRRAGVELRAHPSLEPDRHGHPPAAPSSPAWDRSSWRCGRAIAFASRRRPSRCRQGPRCRLRLFARAARRCRSAPAPRSRPGSKPSCCARGACCRRSCAGPSARPEARRMHALHRPATSHGLLRAGLAAMTEQQQLEGQPARQLRRRRPASRPRRAPARRHPR